MIFHCLCPRPWDTNWAEYWESIVGYWPSRARSWQLQGTNQERVWCRRPGTRDGICGSRGRRRWLTCSAWVGRSPLWLSERFHPAETEIFHSRISITKDIITQSNFFAHDMTRNSAQRWASISNERFLPANPPDRFGLVNFYSQWLVSPFPAL